MRKHVTLLFALALIFPLAKAVFAQEAASKEKESRWEGRVAWSDKDKSTIRIRREQDNAERTVVYDSSTKFVSQWHGDKKVNPIEASDVKDGDYVICKGTVSKDGVLHATLISKRLSHSPGD